MDFAEFQKSLEGLSEEERVNKYKEVYESKSTLEKDLEFQKSENKKAFEKRDATKKEVDALTLKIKELEEKGGHSAEVETLKAELTTLKTENEEYKKQIKEINDSTKAELLGMLPEGDTKKFAEKLGLPELREYVKIHNVPSYDKSKHVKIPKKVEEKSPEEKMAGLYNAKK